MITHSSIYWITRLDGMKEMLNGFSITFAIFGFVMIVIGIIFKGIYLNKISIETDEGREEALVNQYNKRHSWVFRGGIWMMVAMFFMIVLNVMLPTMKQMAAIVIIPRVANAESVQDFGAGIVNLAKEWMEELSPNKLSAGSKAVETAATVVNEVKKAVTDGDGRPDEGAK